MGIHGEPGIRRGKLKSANEITDELFIKMKINEETEIYPNNMLPQCTMYINKLIY